MACEVGEAIIGWRGKLTIRSTNDTWSGGPFRISFPAYHVTLRSKMQWGLFTLQSDRELSDNGYVVSKPNATSLIVVAMHRE